MTEPRDPSDITDPRDVPHEGARDDVHRPGADATGPATGPAGGAAPAAGGGATAIAPEDAAAGDAPAAAEGEAGEGAGGAEGGERREGLLSRLEAAHWLWFAAAVVLVAALGFLAGSQWGSPLFGSRGGEGVNVAGAEPGDGPAAAVPVEGEGPGARYDAAIHGPREGVDLAADRSAGLTALHRRDEHDPFALGAVDAPVVISVFSDFECPFCAKHALETEPRIISDYVEAGLVRLEWNDAPVGGERAVRAAEAGRAAAAQGMFWEYQHAAFEKAREKGQGHPEFTDEELVAIAEAAGVPDMGRFRSDLDGRVWAGAVEDALRHAQTVGVNGTPTFVVGDEAVVGAQPYDVFRGKIEVQLFTAANGI
ncbi:DsbA family protein [Corynebacterium sp. 335C]